MTCVNPADMVEQRIDRVLTQYRESPKLLHVLRTYLGALANSYNDICDLPEKFDIETAVGDQLTTVGKWLGFPRCHCICDISPVVGFDCGTSLRQIVGFECETQVGNWEDCASGLVDTCINDDNLYRKFLFVRRYQILRQFDLDSLETCIRIFFGQQARVLYSGNKKIVIGTGQENSNADYGILQLIKRVLPVALGVKVYFHFGNLKCAGFGEGCGGFNEFDVALTEATEAYQRTGKIAGFCEDWGGFCEPWDAGELLTEDGLPILDENGNNIYTEGVTENAAWLCVQSASWMCQVDVDLYACK